jgi:hypothetical protein
MFIVKAEVLPIRRKTARFRAKAASAFEMNIEG